VKFSKMSLSIIAIVMAQSMRALCICSKEVFMFIETYYNDRAAVAGNISETGIPYPELAGEELTVWRKYLPV